MQRNKANVHSNESGHTVPRMERIQLRKNGIIKTSLSPHSTPTVASAVNSRPTTVDCSTLSLQLCELYATGVMQRVARVRLRQRRLNNDLNFTLATMQFGPARYQPQQSRRSKVYVRNTTKQILSSWLETTTSTLSSTTCHRHDRQVGLYPDNIMPRYTKARKSDLQFRPYSSHI